MSKAEVVKWCLDHSFELIDMIPEEDEEDEQGNLFTANKLSWELLSVVDFVSFYHGEQWPNPSNKY